MKAHAIRELAGAGVCSLGMHLLVEPRRRGNAKCHVGLPALRAMGFEDSGTLHERRVSSCLPHLDIPSEVQWKISFQEFGQVEPRCQRPPHCRCTARGRAVLQGVLRSLCVQAAWDVFRTLRKNRHPELWSKQVPWFTKGRPGRSGQLAAKF